MLLAIPTRAHVDVKVNLGWSYVGSSPVRRTAKGKGTLLDAGLTACTKGCYEPTNNLQNSARLLATIVCKFVIYMRANSSPTERSPRVYTSSDTQGKG
jgi:hypothetical protein